MVRYDRAFPMLILPFMCLVLGACAVDKATLRKQRIIRMRNAIGSHKIHRGMLKREVLKWVVPDGAQRYGSYEVLRHTEPTGMGGCGHVPKIVSTCFVLKHGRLVIGFWHRADTCLMGREWEYFAPPDSLGYRHVFNVIKKDRQILMKLMKRARATSTRP